MSNSQLFANVIVDISHEKLDRSFQYLIPADLVEVLQEGMLVKIPFGRGNRLIKGYVIEITTRQEFDVSKMKEIDSILEMGMEIESKLIALAAWMRRNYGGTMAHALKTVLPVKEKVKVKEKRFLHLQIPKEELKKRLEECKRKHFTAKARLLEAFLEEDTLSYELVIGKLNITRSVITGMEKDGVLTITSEQVYRNPSIEGGISDVHTLLNQEQQQVTQAVLKDVEQGIYKTYLLHGITGSGKTEVYIDLIAHGIEKGKQAIVLIPEISLTYQTVMRFHKRFGQRVSIMNSRMSKGERYDQFLR
ncbi:MAG TPA: DEAD/DEAH box helicase family protein, partial [Candidatus Merdenecus merdavium]|nr:DEAD/DEAH box helicase family protein [Candidatus Merdenecus merdavium]